MRGKVEGLKGCCKTSSAYWRIDLGGKARTSGCTAEHTWDGDAVRLYNHDWSSKRGFIMTAVCYGRENQFWMCNSVSVITGRHDQFSILWALYAALPYLCSWISCPYLLESRKNKLESIASKSHLPACRWVRGRTAPCSEYQDAPLFLYTASLEMFIAVGVSVFKHLSLPLYVSSKIPRRALCSQQKQNPNLSAAWSRLNSSHLTARCYI